MKGSGGEQSDKQTDGNLSRVVEAYEALFPPPPKKRTIQCLWCQAEVTDVGDHIKDAHPKLTIGDYARDFKNAKLIADQSEPEKPSAQGRPITVTAKEARRHPGGRDAALIEKQLDPRDRAAYRDDVKELVEVKGYPKGYTVANLAYDMLEARRYRIAAEDKRAKQPDGSLVVDTAAKEQQRKYEARIQDTLDGLEKARLIKLEKDREQAAEDPLALVNGTLLEAETFVRENVGEFVESCPGCGQMLTPPALPHWAFEPLQTESGKEWPVWSTEGFELVRRRKIRLSDLCLILRTSPEGLKLTASRRGETWPDFIILEREENELRTYLKEADDAAVLGIATSRPTDEATEGPEGEEE